MKKLCSAVLCLAMLAPMAAYADYYEEVIYPGYTRNFDGVYADGNVVSTSNGYFSGNPRDGQVYHPSSGPSFEYDGNTLVELEPTPSPSPSPLPQPPYTTDMYMHFEELPGSSNKICDMKNGYKCIVNAQGYPVSDFYNDMICIGNYIFVTKLKQFLQGTIDFDGNIIALLEEKSFSYHQITDIGFIIGYDSDSWYNIFNEKLEPQLEKGYRKITYVETDDGSKYFAAAGGGKSIIMDSRLNIIYEGSYDSIDIEKDGSISVSNITKNKSMRTYLDSDYNEIFPIEKYSVAKSGEQYIVTDPEKSVRAVGNADGDITSEWYEYIWRRTDDRFVVRNDNNRALADNSGKILGQWFNENIECINENSGMYLVGDDILINKNGEIVNDRCENVKQYGSDMYLANMNDKQVVLSEDGKSVICTYDKIQSLFYNSTDYYVISENGLCGVLDGSGNVIIKPCYTGSKRNYDTALFYYSDEDSCYTDMYDNDLKLISHCEGELILDNEVCKSKKLVNGQERYAFADENGKLLTDFIYEEISYVKYTLADSSGDTICYKVVLNGEEMYIDQSFNRYDTEDRVFYQISHRYGSSVSYKDFGNVVYSSIAGKQAIIDKENNRYILPYTKDSGITALGTTMVKTADGKSSVLDLRGNTIVQLDYKIERADAFQDGQAKINNSFYIDENGNNILPRKYQYISKINKDAFAAIRDGDLLLVKNYDSLTAAYTDIRVLINGFEIPSYIIGDNVVISTDDLKGYGFDVEWKGETRTLIISRNKDYYKVNSVASEKGRTGEIYANVMPTDIRVQLYYIQNMCFNIPLTGYCINDVMYIRPESLETNGISYEYNDADRTLYISVDGLEHKE